MQKLKQLCLPLMNAFSMRLWPICRIWCACGSTNGSPIYRAIILVTNFLVLLHTFWTLNDNYVMSKMWLGEYKILKKKSSHSFLGLSIFQVLINLYDGVYFSIALHKSLILYIALFLSDKFHFD